MRELKSKEALKKQGISVSILDGLPLHLCIYLAIVFCLSRCLLVAKEPLSMSLLHKRGWFTVSQYVCLRSITLLRWEHEAWLSSCAFTRDWNEFVCILLGTLVCSRICAFTWNYLLPALLGKNYRYAICSSHGSSWADTWQFGAGLPLPRGLIYWCFLAQCFCIFWTRRTIWPQARHFKPSRSDGARYGMGLIVFVGYRQSRSLSCLRIIFGIYFIFFISFCWCSGCILQCRVLKCVATLSAIEANL